MTGDRARGRGRRPGTPARLRRLVAPGVVAAAFVAASGGVVGGTLAGTEAQFTATTSAAGNSWQAGSVQLGDDDSGSALVAVSGLLPGSSGAACITVTYSGSLPAAVTLAAVSLSGSLAPHLDLSVQEGSGGAYGSCTGFVPSSVVWSGTATAFAAAASSYATGVGFFGAPTSGVQRTYQVRYSLDAAAPSSAQGGTAALDLRWEAREATPAPLRASGFGADGQLGIGGYASPVLAPTSVGTSTDWTRISAGDAFACGIRTPGTLWCWGANWSDQLGTGTGGQDVPTRVGIASTWVEVSAGNEHGCGIRADRSLWCWGSGGDGQLGVGDTSGRTTPTEVAAGTDWASVAAGGYHTCGVRTDGTLWCWGKSASGQLGLGDPLDPGMPDARIPQPVDGATTWSSVAAGGLHTCATRSDGTAWCWGRNAEGQLGDASTTPRLVPTQLSGTDWALVTAGDSHSCGLHRDRTLACWGLGTQGQLTGSSSVSSPQSVAGTWSAVDAGGFFTCGLKTDRTRWCWGQNVNGGLGDGTDTGRTVPTAAGTAVAALAGGSNFSFALPWPGP
jgi:alpha-tubulin suppressor-like RCC1 family protein